MISYTNAWKIVNSIVIWVVVSVLIVLLYLTLYDSNAQSNFGQNQLLILGFIVLLLLFRYISKIKLGFLEIEFLQKLEGEVKNTLNKLDSARVSLLAAGAPTIDIDAAKSELAKVQSDIETIKLYAHD